MAKSQIYIYIGGYLFYLMELLINVLQNYGHTFNNNLFAPKEETHEQKQ